MATKPLERLMFAQGGLCFFCRDPLVKADASVEHLLASAHGGRNHDDNCVVCCKAMNALLGSMSLKEKIQVVLNQKGEFKCPNKSQAAAAKGPRGTEKTRATTDRYDVVVANLRQRGAGQALARQTTWALNSARPVGRYIMPSVFGSQVDIAGQ